MIRRSRTSITGLVSAFIGNHDFGMCLIVSQSSAALRCPIQLLFQVEDVPHREAEAPLAGA